MSKQYRPGEQAPKTGSYSCYDKNGKCGGSTELKKGQRFPATQHSGSHYELDNEIEWLRLKRMLISILFNS